MDSRMKYNSFEHCYKKKQKTEEVDGREHGVKERSVLY